MKKFEESRRLERFLIKFDLRLTDRQKEAVLDKSGRILLSAVPGSGKTTVLIARTGYMIYELGCAPESILTMTYTVAAARDMKNRFRTFFGDEYADRLEFRTINALCARIIRYYSSHYSSKKPFELAENEHILTAIISALYYELTESFAAESELKEIKTRITYCKNMCLTNDEIKSVFEKEPYFPVLFGKYNETLREKQLMDFDDQMIYAKKILLAYPDILRKITEKYRYISLDEAQDTSKLQHELIRLIAADCESLFMVGDEDQSIYGFRAAYPEAMTSFSELYPGARILYLEENFRSDGHIVAMADKLIKNNKKRYDKTMTAARSSVHKLSFIPVSSPNAQFSYLADAAAELRNKTAVLYRNNESAVPLIDLLDTRGIGFTMKKNENIFFSSPIYADISAVTSFAYNKTDAAAFLSVYYKLSFFISKETAINAANEAQVQNKDIFDILLSDSSISSRTRAGIRQIKTAFDKLLRLNASQAISSICHDMGYADYLHRTHSDPGKLRIFYAVAYNRRSLMDLMDRMEEIRSIIKEHKNSEDYPLHLSTIHSAKGLEYDSVYLLDVYNGILPEKSQPVSLIANHAQMPENEEERRLFYVGITRAINHLYLFRIDNKKSVFLDELTCETTAQKTAKQIPRRQAIPPGFSLQTSQNPPANGTEVIHKVFGRGSVLFSDKDKKTAQVLFRDGRKAILYLPATLKSQLLFIKDTEEKNDRSI